MTEQTLILLFALASSDFLSLPKTPSMNSFLFYQRKIKLRTGTHDEDHRDEELPRPFPVLAVRLIVVPDSVYRETSAFSPHDNRYCWISVAAVNAVLL
jgi:hypothetical protein